MSELPDIAVIAILAVTLSVVVWGLRQALKRPVAEIQATVGGRTDGEYQALARKDGIHPDVADAFEQEMQIRGREIRRKADERRKQEFGDNTHDVPGDPF